MRVVGEGMGLEVIGLPTPEPAASGLLVSPTPYASPQR